MKSATHWSRWLGCLALAALGCGGGPENVAVPKAGGANDAPEISRSVGEEGGVLVFWPRVIPKTQDAAMRETAAAIQSRLRSMVEQAAPERAIDVRPEPERVCGKEGCLAMTVGAALVEVGGGCAVVGLVAEPGMSPTKIVPWVGEVKLANNEVPFREPPESQVTIVDAMPCDEVLTAVDEGQDKLVAAIRAAAQ
jgi:hypothetical protein